MRSLPCSNQSSFNIWPLYSQLCSLFQSWTSNQRIQGVHLFATSAVVQYSPHDHMHSSLFLTACPGGRQCVRHSSLWWECQYTTERVWESCTRGTLKRFFSFQIKICTQNIVSDFPPCGKDVMNGNISLLLGCRIISFLLSQVLYLNSTTYHMLSSMHCFYKTHYNCLIVPLSNLDNARLVMKNCPHNISLSH